METQLSGRGESMSRMNRALRIAVLAVIALSPAALLPRHGLPGRLPATVPAAPTATQRGDTITLDYGSYIATFNASVNFAPAQPARGVQPWVDSQLSRVTVGSTPLYDASS